MTEEEKQAAEAAKAAEGNEEAGKENKGGPSDEFKAKRLEKELEDAKKELAILRDQNKGGDEEDGDDSLEDLYRERETDKVVADVNEEISKLPKTLQEKIKSDPFNAAWFDEREFKFESLGKKVDNPKVKYAIASEVAKKSIKEFAKNYLEETGGSTKTEEKGLGINPTLDKNSGKGGTEDLWNLSDEELLARRNAIKGNK